MDKNKNRKGSYERIPNKVEMSGANSHRRATVNAKRMYALGGIASYATAVKFGYDMVLDLGDSHFSDALQHAGITTILLSIGTYMFTRLKDRNPKFDMTSDHRSAAGSVVVLGVAMIATGVLGNSIFDSVETDQVDPAIKNAPPTSIFDQNNDVNDSLEQKCAIATIAPIPEAHVKVLQSWLSKHAPERYNQKYDGNLGPYTEASIDSVQEAAGIDKSLSWNFETCLATALFDQSLVID